jgi:hypothetical protein
MKGYSFWGLFHRRKKNNRKDNPSQPAVPFQSSRK